MDDDDDPFKVMVDGCVDGSAVEELNFDLNKLHEARPDLGAEELVQFDREVVTNKFRALSVHEIVNEYIS